MARGEVDGGMLAVDGLIIQPLEFPFLPFCFNSLFLFKRGRFRPNEKTAKTQTAQAVYRDPVTQDHRKTDSSD